MRTGGQCRKKIIDRSIGPLISADFKRNEFSVVIDDRWTKTPSERHLYLVFWYDNEWGYSNRVVDVAQYVMHQVKNKKTDKQHELNMCES